MFINSDNEKALGRDILEYLDETQIEDILSALLESKELIIKKSDTSDRNTFTINDEVYTFTVKLEKTASTKEDEDALPFPPPFITYNNLD